MLLKNTFNLIRIFTNSTNAFKTTQIAQARAIKRWVAPTLRELQRRKEKAPEKPNPRSGHAEWNYEAELFAFGNRLGERFEAGALCRALTERAYANKQQDGVEVMDNFEMIGKGREIIAAYLEKEFEKFPRVVREVLKGHLTQDWVFAEIGAGIGLKDIILSNDFPIEEKSLSEAFCAIIAALEQSSGSETTEKFLKDFLVTRLTGKELFDVWNLEDSYDYLKKLIPEKKIEARLCNQSGSNTILSNYQVGLYSDKKLLGIGFGETIEGAKNTAALDALNRVYSGRTSFI